MNERYTHKQHNELLASSIISTVLLVECKPGKKEEAKKAATSYTGKWLNWCSPGIEVSSTKIVPNEDRFMWAARVYIKEREV